MAQELRRLNEECARLRARASETVTLKHELQALRAENSALAHSLKEAEAGRDAARRNVEELEQRLLRAEAENSATHESLREAQELLEESVAGTSWERVGAERLEHVRTQSRQAEGELSGLLRRLKELQEALRESERAQRTHQRAAEQGRRDLAFLLSGVRELAETANEPGLPDDLGPDTVRAGHAVIMRCRSALEVCRAQLADRDMELQLTQRWGPTSEPSPTSTAPRQQASGRAEQALREELRRVTAELDAARAQQQSSRASDRSGVPAQLQQALRDLAEARAEAVRLREEKRRLLSAVKAAAAQRRLQDEHDARRRGRGPLASDGGSFDSDQGSSDTDGAASSVAAHRDPNREDTRRSREHARQLQQELTALRDERDKLVDQLVAARASAQAAELLKIDTQEERHELMSKLEEAHARLHEMQQRMHTVRAGPSRTDRATSPHRLPDEPYGAGLGLPGGDDVAEIDDGLEVVPVAAVADSSAGGDGTETVVPLQPREQTDEVAFNHLKDVLQQTQHLLERSDQQLCDERVKSRERAALGEELRVKLEAALRELAELRNAYDRACVERDQWGQAARDADDARRKLIEHVERLQGLGTGSPRRGPALGPAPGHRGPDAAELMRDKAEQLVQIDILKERLADCMEELEGSRRELVASLDARSGLKREQEKSAQLQQALLDTEAVRDKLLQEKEQLAEDHSHLQVQLDNANLVKKCSSERLENLRREMDEMRGEYLKLQRENQAQMKEIAFLCDTLTETSAQYEDSTQQLEGVEQECSKLGAEKHKHLQRIEELSGQLTKVRLQNDKDAIEERKQLQQEREFDALLLADRMRELDECKEEMAQVKTRANKAISVLKTSLQNALMQMKSLGDGFEVERADLQGRILALDKQLREKSSECESLKAETRELALRTGNAELKSKVDSLSAALDRTKAKYQEQSVLYEKTRAELRSARKALQENASFKELFEAASEHTEALTHKNRQLIKETHELRTKADSLGRQEEKKQQQVEDEATQALREQLSALQRDLRREKDLRLRLSEENTRIRRELEEYEETTKGMLAEQERRTEDSNRRLAEMAGKYQESLQRWAEDRDQVGDSAQQLEVRMRMLQCDVDERDAKLDDMGRALETKETAIGELREGLVSCKRELAQLEDTLHRIETVALGFAPQPAHPTDDREGRSRTDIAAAALYAVRSALEHLHERVVAAHVNEQGNVGRVAAEYQEARADLASRLRRAEAERACAAEEAGRLGAEARRLREDNASLRQELLRATDLSSNAEALQRRNESLQQELTDALDERDRALRQATEQRSGDSAHVTSMREANEAAAALVERMQREVGNTRAEHERCCKERDSLKGIIDGLNRTLRETQRAVENAQKQAADARRERDEAAQHRDRAVRERQAAARDLEELRRELQQSQSDFARLQAVSQDLDGLNSMVDDTQGELARTRDLLDATRAELRKVLAARDRDVAAAVEEQRTELDAELRAALREREEMRRRLESAARDRENAEKTLIHDRELARVEDAQHEQDRRQAAEEIAQLRMRVRQLEEQEEDLRHQLAIAAARSQGADDGAAPAGQPGELSALRAEAAALRSEVDRRRRDADRAREDCEALRAELSRVSLGRADQQALHGALAANADDLHSMARRLTRQEAELRRAEDRARAADEELSKVTAQLRATEAALEVAEGRCRQLETDLAAAHAELAETKRELDEGRDLMLSLVGPPPEGIEPRDTSQRPPPR